MKIQFYIDWAHWIFGVNRFDNKAFGLAGVTWGFHFGPCIWLINK